MDGSEVGRVVGAAFGFRDDVVCFEAVLGVFGCAADGAGDRVGEDDGACLSVGAGAAVLFRRGCSGQREPVGLGVPQTVHIFDIGIV